jgi:hypothetical protein
MARSGALGTVAFVPQFDEETAPVPPAPDDFEPPQSPTEEERKDAAHDDHEGPD